MNTVKKQITKELAAKGSDFLVDNILKMNNSKGRKGKVRGRKKRKLLAKQAKEHAKAKEDLKKFIEQQIENFL